MLVAITACVGLAGCQNGRWGRNNDGQARRVRYDDDRLYVERTDGYRADTVDWRDEGVRWSDGWYDDSQPEPVGHTRTYYRTTVRR